MNFKKNYIYFINLAMIILVMIGDALYLKFDTLLFKSITSAMFVILGIINLIYAFTNGKTNRKFSIIILIGLFFAMLGDILLEVNFMIGAIFFAVGHIFFFVSYMFVEPFKGTDLFYGFAIILPAVLFITLAPIFKFSPIMEVLCVVYAIVISFMLGKAIANLVRHKTNTNIVIFLGSFLFFFSDLMLLFNVFGSGAKVFSYLCLLTYYPAEILLAISILVTSIFYESIQPKQVMAENNTKAEKVIVSNKTDRAKEKNSNLADETKETNNIENNIDETEKSSEAENITKKEKTNNNKKTVKSTVKTNKK